MDYLPIEDYGIIGDLNTVALVGLNGSIDFMCFPYFDSPTIFAALLDNHKGGFFRICPVHDDIHHKQMYLPETNILLTRFLGSEGVGEITDFMPVQEVSSGVELVRRVTTVRGKLHFRMECKPRFDYGRAQHKIIQINSNTIIFNSEGPHKLSLCLKSSVPIELEGGDAWAEFTLGGNESVDFIFERITDEEKEYSTDDPDFVEQALVRDIKYWRGWIDISKYTGRWREMVYRSALVLKLLTSHEYGSIIAAPTFALPEFVGGERNWDYRYTWLRDAAFSMYALLRLGYTKEAADFMDWMENRCADIPDPGHLHLMYTAKGSKDIAQEEQLDFQGYHGSKPVRIGNHAVNQFQLDIYGELMNCVYLYDKHAEPISYNFWLQLSGQINWLTDNWMQKDHSIWEVRAGTQEFLYSRLMCWVAFDRAIKLGISRSLPIPDQWQRERDKIFYSIHNDFWNPEKEAFVQYKGGEAVDASALMMPIVKFISPQDPKWLSTLSRIEKELVSDSLVYRYSAEGAAPDGMSGPEGTFSMCSFWYVECLAMAGELQKARFYFEKMLGYANHVGLYSEQLGPKGEHLGNFPQAFSHLGLISAAFKLDTLLNDERNKERHYPLFHKSTDYYKLM